MKFIKSIIATANVLLLCNALYSQANQTYLIRDNTILPNSNCDIIDFRGVYSIGNINISNYYIKKDDINYAINGIHYKILILSPISQEFGYDTFYCDSQETKRLFVNFRCIREDSLIVNYINEDLIPRRQDFQNEPYQGFKIVSDTMLLDIFFGSSIKCNNQFIFKMEKTCFYLSKNIIDCYTTDLEKHNISKKIYNDKKYINEINITDYLYSNLHY